MSKSKSNIDRQPSAPKPEPAERYILDGYPSMMLGDREIRRGEEIDAETYNEIHRGSRWAFRRVGE